MDGAPCPTSKKHFLSLWSSLSLYIGLEVAGSIAVSVLPKSVWNRLIASCASVHAPQDGNYLVLQWYCGVNFLPIHYPLSPPSLSALLLSKQQSSFLCLHWLLFLPRYITLHLSVAEHLTYICPSLWACQIILYFWCIPSSVYYSSQFGIIHRFNERGGNVVLQTVMWMYGNEVLKWITVGTHLIPPSIFRWCCR